MTRRGRFITLEGGEGVGKSTQAQRLAEWLKSQDIPCVTTREPGGTPGAEAIRSLLVKGIAWGGISEICLFLAARSDHWHKVIAPALEAGSWVICDRYQDSTTAYQGYARGLGPGYVEQLFELTLGAAWPDMTVILDLPATEGLARAKASADAVAGDRFEAEALAFHERLREGFHDIARRNPERCSLLSAEGSPEEVAKKIRKAVETRLQQTHGA